MSDRMYSALRWAAITPSDTVQIRPTPIAVYVGGAGNVTAIGDNGVSAVFAASAGQTLAIQPSFVMATGTTATALVRLYN